MNGQRTGAWTSRTGAAEQPKAPYIPQPDYTPLPTRRADSFKLQTRPQTSALKHQLPPKPIITPHPDASATLPRVEEKRIKTSRPASIHKIEETSERVWHHPQWHSSQFLANDWNAALMKRLSVEAKSLREQKILREANKELERFETEIESYLEEDEEEEQGRIVAQQKSATRMVEEEGEHQQKTTSSGSSTPNSSSTITSSPPCPSTPISSSPRVQQQQHYHSHSGGVAAASVAAPVAGASSSAATSSATASQQSGGSTSSTDGRARRSLRDRDQISLESGYMSSYPGDAQRHNGAF